MESLDTAPIVGVYLPRKEEKLAERQSLSWDERHWVVSVKDANQFQQTMTCLLFFKNYYSYIPSFVLTTSSRL